MLSQSMTIQANQMVVAPLNMLLATTAVRDFKRMIHGSKVDEYPQDFIDEVYKIVAIIGVSLKKKSELVPYQLKGGAQVWHNQ